MLNGDLAGDFADDFGIAIDGQAAGEEEEIAAADAVDVGGDRRGDGGEGEAEGGEFVEDGVGHKVLVFGRLNFRLADWEIIHEQGDEFFSAFGEGGLVGLAGDQVAGEVAVRDLGWADGDDHWGIDVALAGSEGYGHSGGAEADFPCGGLFGVFAADPWMALHEIRGAFGGDCDFEIHWGGGDEFAEFEFGIGFVGEEKPSDIRTGEVHAVVVAVVVDDADGPIIEALAHQHREFKVDVGAGAVQAGAGVAHASEHGPRFHEIAGFAGDFREVRVEGINL